jgi:hypothetical protein
LVGVGVDVTKIIYYNFDMKMGFLVHCFRDIYKFKLFIEIKIVENILIVWYFNVIPCVTQ